MTHAQAVAQPTHNGYSEEDAKRIETEMQELDFDMREALRKIDALEADLTEGPPLELLRRIRSALNIGIADMPRLAVEAHGQVRGT